MHSGQHPNVNMGGDIPPATGEVTMVEQGHDDVECGGPPDVRGNEQNSRNLHVCRLLCREYVFVVIMFVFPSQSRLFDFLHKYESWDLLAYSISPYHSTAVLCCSARICF